MTFFGQVEKATIPFEFCPRFWEAEKEARPCKGRAAVQWVAKMSDGQTVHSAVIYPNGIQERSQVDYQTSIQRQLRMRFPKIGAVGVSVTGLWYEAQSKDTIQQIIL